MKTVKMVLFIIAPLFTITAYGQSVGINTDGSAPDASAMLDISSTTKGLLIPRMTNTERTNISSPAAGLMVYDTSEAIIYFYTGAKWQRLDAVVVGNNSGDLPTSPYAGQLYLDTSGMTDKLYIYTSGGQWSEIMLGTPGSIY